MKMVTKSDPVQPGRSTHSETELRLIGQTDSPGDVLPTICDVLKTFLCVE